MSSHLRAIESSLRLSGLAHKLEVALAASPTADQDAGGAGEVLEACDRTDADTLQRVWQTHSDQAVRILAALSSFAPFFVPIFSRHPELFLELACQDLATPRTTEDYQLGLARMIGDRPLAEHSDIVRRYKYRELARITARDLLADIVPLERVGEVLHELSHLADALLAQCLASATAALGDK